MTRALLLLALSTSASSVLVAAAPDPAALTFFEKEVRPLLIESCQDCHGAQKHKGGLRLDNLPYILQGGETGPAIVPHKPDTSLLIKLVNYEDPDMEMPPDGKLAPEKIAILKKWIALGAPWPEAEAAAAKPARKPGQITEEDRQWWSFQPLKSPQPPKLSTDYWALSTSPVDAFIGTKLAQNNLQPSPPATPKDFIRRAYYDLTGLPPTPEETFAFEREMATTQNPASSIQHLVNRLLDSPRYGERWAQHWLDLVRYADSEGYRLDAYRPNVWPYRDYVISSLNNDKPYDQFVREQIAGDELLYATGKTIPETQEELDQLIATGFLRHTIYEYNQRDSEGQWKLIMNEVTDVTADVFMGMSVQCAQCHDHKFDPILHKDYYRLQAFFSNIVWAEDKPLATKDDLAIYNAQLKAWQDATVEPRAMVDSILERRITSAQRRAVEKFPEEVQAMFAKPKEQRTAYEEQIVQLAGRQVEYERERYKPDKISGKDADIYKEGAAKLAEFASLKPKPLVTLHAIGETGTAPGITKFASRKSGEVTVAPGFLTVLDPTDARIPTPSAGAPTTGRRTVLANWLTDPKNPLAARVIVNRVWQYHFGKGLVSTASDFGHLGEKPTHPELLDWLSSEFIKSGWKLKHLHRLIMNSATYQQSAQCSVISAQSDTKSSPKAQSSSGTKHSALSTAERSETDSRQAAHRASEAKSTHSSPETEHSPLSTEHFQTALRLDPDNRLLWRFPPLRLDAEQSRDSMLMASGEIDLTAGGEGVEKNKPRRSIYLRKMRNTQDDFLASMDAPPGFQSVAERQATTTATQSLLMVNGDWPLDRARNMAVRLLKEHPRGTDDPKRVASAYQYTLGRSPSEAEAADALAFVQQQRTIMQREAPPPPPVINPLADASKELGPIPAARTTKAFLFHPGSPNEKLRVNLEGRLEPEQFAVESVVRLDSLYPDAGVRTIASRWDNDKTKPGWSFGVTSEKSAHKPNNLIIQLSGFDFQGSPVYEPIASGLRIPVGKPYYVAASLDNHPAPGQAYGGTITFYARDLSDPNAPMQTATIAHQIGGGYINKDRAIYLGGREIDKRSLWDGAIARVALRSGRLDSGRLMTWAAVSDPTCIADISADQALTMLKAPKDSRWTYESSTAPTKTPGAPDPIRESLTDLCHALLNSNEFFYLQ